MMEINLEKLFFEQGEVQFIFNNKSYLIAKFGTKKLFRKIKIDYCFFPPKDSTQDIQKFDTLDELLNIEIDGHKLKDILPEIEII